ncbi:hypothetical protein WDZ17_04475, partial [Pseudokineococcus basanitobsidens]
GPDRAAAGAGRAAAPAGAPTTAGAPAAGPVFAGLRGGVGRLAEVLAARLARDGVDVRTGTPATALRPLGAGTHEDGADEGDGGGADEGGDGARWLVSTPSGDVRARAVVVALPAPSAARLLADVAPSAAQRLSHVRTASSAIVTLVVPGRALAGAGHSGLLVPPVDGRLVKAATFSGLKWGWLAEQARALLPDDPPAVLRVSAGRAGEERVLDRDDADLLATAAAEVGGLLGGEPLPVLAGRVDRWRGGLPQYDVGHADLVAAVRDDVARRPGLVLAGSAYDGVGVPACVGLGRAAARQVLGPGSSTGSSAGG